MNNETVTTALYIDFTHPHNGVGGDIWWLWKREDQITSRYIKSGLIRSKYAFTWAPLDQRTAGRTA